MKIALLENHAHHAESIANWLRSAGHVAVLYDSVKSFMRDVSHDNFDLLMVGAHVPDNSATEVLMWLRERVSASVPVLRISASNDEDYVVDALKSGADDCRVMPLRRGEFLARVEVLGRRIPRKSAPAENLTFGDLKVDLKNRVISRNGRRIALTPKSYDLAVFLFSNLGQLLSRSYLMERIWGRGASTSTRTLDTHISRLRTDLSLTAENGWHLQSVYQHGYRLDQTDSRPLGAQGFKAVEQQALVA
jgi:two-component system response regulator RegX3